MPVLFCDIDALAAAIWHERYMGRESDEVWQLADPTRYGIHVVTDHNIPFEQVGIRDGEHLCDWMTRRGQRSVCSWTCFTMRAAAWALMWVAS